ncbi:MAG TPA: hypothetical protein PLL76_02040 [Thermoanaerobaculia bacterium]|nr:hypothetical protein [Thermoanaerobaculia bacterium]HQP85012.1 hypothetical protein [Thermoanaerobaculia bacterium]
MRRLNAAWAAARARAKARAFPPGSVTFHLGAWARGSLAEDEAEAARALLEEHGFSGLLVLHGSALEVDGSVVLVVGPRGIGKSTACRELVLHGRGRFLEDGLLVVGELEGAWRLVETGTLPVLRRTARLKAGPRRLLPRVGGMPHPSERWAEGLRRRLHRALDEHAFRAAVLLAGGRPTGSAGCLRTVDRVVVAEEPFSPSGSFETDGRGMRELPDVASRVPASCGVRRLAATGPRAEVVARLVAAMRG